MSNARTTYTYMNIQLATFCQLIRRCKSEYTHVIQSNSIQWHSFIQPLENRNKNGTCRTTMIDIHLPEPNPLPQNPTSKTKGPAMFADHKRSLSGRERRTTNTWQDLDLEANDLPGPLLLSETERKESEQDEQLRYLASPLGLAVQIIKKMFKWW